MYFILVFIYGSVLQECYWHVPDLGETHVNILLTVVGIPRMCVIKLCKERSVLLEM